MGRVAAANPASGANGTLHWVDWFNHRRLLEPIGKIPRAETRINIMLPQTSSIWRRHSQPNACGRPGAVHSAMALIQSDTSYLAKRFQVVRGVPLESGLVESHSLASVGS